MCDTSLEASFNPIVLYAFEKSSDHIRKFVAPYLCCRRASTINVSMSFGQYVSLAPTARFAWDFVRSSIALYFGCWFPCCSAMRNGGDSTSKALSCCVADVGFDNHHFWYSATDISQHLACSVGLFARCECRKIFRFRATRLVFMLMVGNISRFVSALGGRMFREISSPLIMSRGSFFSG